MARNLEEYLEYVKDLDNDLLIELYKREIIELYRYKISEATSGYGEKEFFENRVDICKKEILKRMNTHNLAMTTKFKETI